MERFSAIEIFTIHSGFLGYQDQFLDALRSHIFSLLQKAFFRNAAELTAQRRDDAISAVLVTAFCDFKISKMSAGGDDAATGIFRKIIDITEFLKDISCLCFI